MADTGPESKTGGILSVIAAPALWLFALFGRGGRIVSHALLIIIALVFLGALFGTEKKAERVDMTEKALNAEDREAIPQEEEMRLYQNLMRVVQAMQYSDLSLQGREAAKIGGVFFPIGEKISIKEMDFSYRTSEVYVHYEHENGNDVILEMTPFYFRKTFTRYEGVSVKFTPRGILKTIRWYVWGQFSQGYAQYTYESDMRDGSPSGTPAVSKQVFRTEPFEKVTRFFRLFQRAVVYAATSG